MGKGGPLAFLAKKPWHPARFSNQEEVWKRQAAAAAEEKKAEELKKQLEEERKQDEFHQLAQDAGHIKQRDRLDWMYQGGLAAKEDAEKKAEEHLLGKAATLPSGPGPQETSRCEETSNLPSFLNTATPASQNEAWARLNNDPLLMIKKRQADQLKTIRDNPIRMQQIIQEIQSGKHGKDKKKKKEKKSKKDKKGKHGRSSESGSDDEAAEAEANRRLMPPPPRPSDSLHGGRGSSGDVARPSYGGRARSRSRSPVQNERHGAGRPQDRFESRDGPTIGTGRGMHSREGGRGRDDEEEARRHSRGGDEHRGRGGDDQDHRRSGSGDGEHRAGRDERRNGDDNRARDEHRDRGGHRGGSSSSRDTGRGGGGGDEGPRRSREQREDREERGDGASKETAPGSREAGRGSEQGATAIRPPLDEGGLGLGGRYGLAHGTSAPEHLRHADTSGRGAETRARLDEAVKVKQEEERTKAGLRHQKKDYRTGQMSEEERQKRLAEMTSNASEHQQHRGERILRAKAADAATEGRLVANTSGVGGRDGDAFTKAASRDVYAALSANAGSLEARISSRKHFNAK